MARKEPPIETIMKALSKECERRKEMTKIFYATVEILSEIDEFLERREWDYKNAIKDTQEWLEEKKKELSKLNEELNEEDFNSTYDWRFKDIDECKRKVAIIEDLRTKLPKLAQ